MLKKLVSVASFVAVSVVAAVVLADVAPSCKCETPGTSPVAGGAGAAAFAMGATIAVLGRKRGRRL